MNISQKLNKLIPGGCHTYSKGDDQFPANAPEAIISGVGARVQGSDGREYLDWAMGLTSVSLGHGDQDVLTSVIAEIKKGTNFSRPSILELDAAEFFLEKVAPFHRMVKFTKNGSTATTAALKLARAFTGRELVAMPKEFPFFSYDDWFIGGTDCPRGTQNKSREQILKFQYGDIDSLKTMLGDYGKDICAVIMEPVKFKLPPKNYLNDVKTLCDKYGIIFIIDEMWCGAKIAISGGQGYFDVEADLATWGKGIANGFSCCALSGKDYLMELGGIKQKNVEKVFLVSTTHGAESVGLAAMMSTINKIMQKRILEENFIYAEKLYLELNTIIYKHGLEKIFKVIGDTRVVQAIEFKPEIDFKLELSIRTFIYQEMINSGILFNGLFYVMASHRDLEIEKTLSAFNGVIERLAAIMKHGSEIPVNGSVIKPVFRKYN